MRVRQRWQLVIKAQLRKGEGATLEILRSDTEALHPMVLLKDDRQPG